MAVDLRSIAQHELAFLGGDPKATRYRHDENDELWVDVLECVDRPHSGMTSYATIGMSTFDNHILTADDRPLRLELVGACQSSYPHFPNALATCAFNVATSEFRITPGTIHPQVFGMYAEATPLPHAIFVPPFTWDGQIQNLSDPSMEVTWLQIAPVADAEMEYAREHGSDALQTRLEQEQVDVLDVNRASVV